MRFYKYLFFSVLLVLSACTNQNRIPNDVIPMERMPAIVAEVEIVDGDMSTISQATDSLYKFGMGHYIALFKKYHTDTAQFRKSYTWYTRHPLLLDSISNQVITILQKKSDSITKIKAPVVKPATPSVSPVPPANNAVPAK